MPNNVPTVDCKTPTEILGLFRQYIERNRPYDVIWLRGIYQQRIQNPNWTYAFDELRDPSTNDKVKLKINRQEREKLKANSLVLVGGLLEIDQRPDSTVELLLKVTRYEVIKDQYLSELEMRLIELKQRKKATQYKNVKMLIGQALFEGVPKIAIIVPQTTVTRGDFESGLRAARSAIKFVEFTLNLWQTVTLCDKLRQLDTEGYTAIAIFRGGGVDSAKDVDKPEVVETVVGLNTPFICGVGHEGENIFLRQVADAWTCTPQGLGQLFSEIVEEVSAKRAGSQAAMMKQVESQYKKQIDDFKKQIDVSQKQIENLNKNNQEITKQLLSTQQANSNLQIQLERRKNNGWLFIIVAILSLAVGVALTLIFLPEIIKLIK